MCPKSLPTDPPYCQERNHAYFGYIGAISSFFDIAWEYL